MTTESDEQIWTLDALKIHFDRVLEEKEKQAEQAQEAGRLLTEKTLMGEVRVQTEERDARFALKDEQSRMNTRIEKLESSRDKAYGGIGVVGLIGIVNLAKWLFE